MENIFPLLTCLSLDELQRMEGLPVYCRMNGLDTRLKHGYYLVVNTKQGEPVLRGIQGVINARYFLESGGQAFRTILLKEDFIAMEKQGGNLT